MILEVAKHQQPLSSGKGHLEQVVIESSRKAPQLNSLRLASSSSSSSAASSSVSSPVGQSVSLSTTTKLLTHEMDQQNRPFRRSANYQPPHWDFDYLQSLNNQYSGEIYIRRCNLLKENIVKMMMMLLLEEDVRLNQLEFIDDLQRLGVSYHFQDKIQSILSKIYQENCIMISDLSNGNDLYATALAFRLMRQHGFNLSQDAFDRFKDKKGNFKPELCKDIKGMLQLYEASYLQTENESTLESAREFTAKHLKKCIDEEKGLILMDQQLGLLVQHALEIPLHWRMLRLEARWFIDVYEKRVKKNASLLELAKLDFNIVQATHQNDLKYGSMWWQDTCLARKLEFSRDRLVENFFWTIGVIFDPEYGYCRRMSTKVNALITTIDDVYDVYGTLEELELFTHAVHRWDVEAMDELPDYMKMCYFQLYNSINEMAYDAMKEKGVNIIPYLRKAWADLCKTYLQEAKWYHSGYIPTLQEYLNNAWISISAPVILVHAYFFVSNPITDEGLKCLDTYHSIIRYSAMILRLADDLGTSSEELKRGDVPKSVECHMNETGVSEEAARQHIKFLISETWKKLNTEGAAAGSSSPFPKVFIGIAMNLGRMAQCMYEHGDGHGHSNPNTKDRIRALLFEPISVLAYHIPKRN